jgi:NADPH-dependent curcumin reductase CurA
MNRQIILNSRPVGMPVPENFAIIEAPQQVLQHGELMIKPKFISVDPYMRGRMGTGASNLTLFEVGKPLAGAVLAEVINSRHPGFHQGEMIKGNFLWQELQVVKAEQATRIETEVPTLSDHLGILGLTGLTAYFGLLEIGKPVWGETVVVSGAAGAVGNVVGQLARIKGCRVIGIAGSDDKIDFLKNELRFDEAVNYHQKDWEQSFASLCPVGVDIYFDNVGGEISDIVLKHINKFARIIICGQISQYNNTILSIGPRIQPLFIGKSALMQSFTVSNYSGHFGKALEEMTDWLKTGKLVTRETIIKGFENLPAAFIGLFQGKNTGKCLVEIL